MEFWNGTSWQGLSAAKVRALLAVLLIRANQMVSTGQLIDELWPDDAPSGAKNQVHGLVTRLRRALDDDRKDVVVTRNPGYQLALTCEDTDVWQFEDMVEKGRRELRGGNPGPAAELLRRALSLWRGPALADIEGPPLVESEVARLAELRQTALETRIDCDLACGRHTELISELRALTDADPLRERTWAQLMTAEHRAGRQADALRSYERMRATLRTELGVGPSAEMRRLHETLSLPVKVPATEPAAPPVPVPAPATPAQLPADLASFVGREAEGDRLRLLLRPSTPGARSAATVVAVISGMAGVGKTALAVHWAHRLHRACPDGQLFLDLHGFSRGRRPVEPAQALHRLLRSLHVPEHRIPDEVDDRAALFRTQLAHRRFVILLDNAADVAQVEPLIPATSGCLVIVTSRSDLSGLSNARSLRLDLLPVSDAVRLFTDIVGTERFTEAETALAEEIAEYCGRLPLALRIAGNRMRSRPSWKMSYLADRLRDQRWRLFGLREGHETIAAAFELSYRQLGARQQHMFRRLSLHPGHDVEPYAAAALADTTVGEAHQLLEDLVDAHLLFQHAPGRYVFHGLLHSYAAALAEQGESDAQRRAALARLLDHYLCAVSAAVGEPAPWTERFTADVSAAPTLAPVTAQQPASTRWLMAERANLLAAVECAADNGWPGQAAYFDAVLCKLFDKARRRGDGTTGAATPSRPARAVRVWKAAGQC
ncbi:BTAD domain-containing putative transcriptional regulator [Streptomyces sp. NPDC048106]|uniref:AfsR/SARP family transcriptional regulator n=1 Tax=Streptomyces sp. NPDC048106 TaxID=3155750 RepID=UPI0034544015